jgi:acyl-coenzyme A thioesterase PaaI-like protein
MPWTFGAEPLPQTATAASLIRRVAGLLLALEGEEPDVERLISELRAAEASLADRVPAAPGPRVGDAATGDGRVYLDHAFDIGAYNPCFPEYGIRVDGDHATGSVSFPLPYEGPPGIVHGGFLAVFFDCVVQHHNCEVGVAGKTTSLVVRYRRPVPLLETLSFNLERAVSDGRIRSTAELRSAERVLCEAEIDAVAGDRSTLPAVSPRRTPS